LQNITAWEAYAARLEGAALLQRCCSTSASSVRGVHACCWRAEPAHTYKSAFTEIDLMLKVRLARVDRSNQVAEWIDAIAIISSTFGTT